MENIRCGKDRGNLFAYILQLDRGYLFAYILQLENRQKVAKQNAGNVASTIQGGGD